MTTYLPPIEKWIEHAHAEPEYDDTLANITALAIVAEVNPDSLDDLFNQHIIEPVFNGGVVESTNLSEGLLRIQAIRFSLGAKAFALTFFMSSFFGAVSSQVADRVYEKLTVDDIELTAESNDSELDNIAVQATGFFAGGLTVLSLRNRGQGRRVQKAARKMQAKL